jgi:hypothetical protein
MAFVLATSGSLTLASGANNAYTAATLTRPVSAAFDFTNAVGCVVVPSWSVQFVAGTWVVVWVGSSTAIGSDQPGVVTPVIPVGRAAKLDINLSSGSPTGAVHWDVYSL